MPANQILNLPPGSVFVHRNVGNLCTHKDLNAMACLEYAVSVLKVEHVIVCGHHGCGAVGAALTFDAAAASLVNLWVADVRDTRNLNLETLASLEGAAEKVNRLVELNVVRQVFNVCTAPAVQVRGKKGGKQAKNGGTTGEGRREEHRSHPSRSVLIFFFRPPPHPFSSQAAWAAGQRLAVHGLVYSLADGLLKELAAPITGPRALQAHVDDASDPGWPHATRCAGGGRHRAQQQQQQQSPPPPASPSARGAGVLPSSTDCKATTTAAIVGKMESVLSFAAGAEREREAEAAEAAARR